MSSFQGKVISITGAVSGIGLSLAQLLGARGARLAVADVQGEALAKVRVTPLPTHTLTYSDSLRQVVEDLKASGVDIVGTTLDVTSSEAVNDWVSATVEHFGHLDGAANIAGVTTKEAKYPFLADVTNEEWEFVMSINATGLFYLLRAQLRVLGTGSAIVNASSGAGLVDAQAWLPTQRANMP